MGQRFSEYLKKEDVKVNEMSKDLLGRAAAKAEVQGREPERPGSDTGFGKRDPNIRRKRRAQSIKFAKGFAKKEFGEASTYRDRTREDEKDKKRHGKKPPSQKGSRWGRSGYGKGHEEVETDKEGNFKDFKSFFEGMGKSQNYGVVKIEGKPERIPQHSSGEIVFLGNKRVASKHLKQLKKDGNNGYLSFGMHQKIGDKVKGK
jgi:hypothetical protein